MSPEASALARAESLVFLMEKMNNHPTTFLRAAAAIGALILGFSACGKKQPPPPPAKSAPARFLTPPPPIPSADEVMKLLPTAYKKLRPDLLSKTLTMYSRDSFLKWLAAKDRAEMIRPAPPDWKPLSPGYKIKLTLIPQKTMLRKRQAFWYRLEMQNVGSEAVDFHDSPYSVFKTGSGSSNDFDFFVTEPDGTVERMSSPLNFDGDCTGFGREIHIPGIEQMTRAQKDAALGSRNEEDWREDQRNNNVRLTLRPGETLLGRPWQHVNYCGEKYRNWAHVQRDLPAEGSFRELYTDYVFEKTGTHRMKAVYRDMPMGPDKEKNIKDLVKQGFSREKQLKVIEEIDRKKLGVVESNEVSVEVSW